MTTRMIDEILTNWTTEATYKGVFKRMIDEVFTNWTTEATYKGVSKSTEVESGGCEWEASMKEKWEIEWGCLAQVQMGDENPIFSPNTFPFSLTEKKWGSEKSTLYT